MSKIKLNRKTTTDGSFSFRASLRDDVKPPILEITGVLETKAPILFEIHEIENERYHLEGVQVKEEAYGSEEDYVNYLFVARDFKIKSSNHEAVDRDG